jgi:hypothetical protein
MKKTLVDAALIAKNHRDDEDEKTQLFTYSHLLSWCVYLED